MSRRLLWLPVSLLAINSVHGQLLEVANDAITTPTSASTQLGCSGPFGYFNVWLTPNPAERENSQTYPGLLEALHATCSICDPNLTPDYYNCIYSINFPAVTGTYTLNSNWAWADTFPAVTQGPFHLDASPYVCAVGTTMGLSFTANPPELEVCLPVGFNSFIQTLIPTHLRPGPMDGTRVPMAVIILSIAVAVPIPSTLRHYLIRLISWIGRVALAVQADI